MSIMNLPHIIIVSPMTAKLSIVELLFIQVLRQLKLKLMVFKFSVYISSNFISITRGVLPRNIFSYNFPFQCSDCIELDYIS